MWDVALLSQLFDPITRSHIQNTTIRGTHSIDKLRIQYTASIATLLQQQTRQHARLQPSIWIPPKKDIIKINVDISFRTAANPIGIGFSFRDYKGKFLLAGTVGGKAGSSEEAECWGILEAIRQGLHQQLRIIESRESQQSLLFIETNPTSKEEKEAMGRPRRAVRSARDKWFKARRYTPVLERLFAVVRRTFCEHHFDQFQSFRDGMNRFCTMVAEADPSIEVEISAFFPNSDRFQEQSDFSEDEIVEVFRMLYVPKNGSARFDVYVVKADGKQGVLGSSDLGKYAGSLIEEDH
ncbi:hypothetical protein FRX31_027408 [Thalictrum thalictroides]|uniref:RNase H type-1 domain-containing protein n=1 Tax=Thalictrum thalictroides TaxID=46969 RepID=A0A7J6VFL0_THATH|nr:hypothetical protein FRX31_027408 [Thalictrum thalictroides]